MSKKVDKLLENLPTRGCKLGHLEGDAALFLEGVRELYFANKNPHITRANQILQEEWNIVVPRRRLSDHIRGECGCQKK